MHLSGISRLCAIALCLTIGTTNNANAAPALTLRDALTRVLKESPRIRSAAASIQASQGTRQQADAWMNPELSFISENIGGDGVYNGTDAAENTLGLSQRIEIGGKRSGRLAVAEHALTMSQYDAAIARTTLIRDTKAAYADAVAAQEMLALAIEQRNMAKELSSEVGERVSAARDPIIQSKRAKITLATAEVAEQRARREAQHARHVLSSLWGGHDEDYVLDTSDFFQLTAPPHEVEIEEKLDKGLDLTKLKEGELLGKARYELEKANAIPDPTINAGIRRFNATDDQAFIVGVSLPIPILNGNRGNIQRARAEASKAESDTVAHQLSLRNEVFESLESMTNAYEHADSFDRTILPAAEQAFTLAREGYRAGKFPYLEVLDAQRTLFATKEQRIATLKEYHTAKAELERVTTPAVIQEEEKKNAE